MRKGGRVVNSSLSYLGGPVFDSRLASRLRILGVTATSYETQFIAYNHLLITCCGT
jgi:hypothetical protein